LFICLCVDIVRCGRLAQMVERPLRMREVGGSIPPTSNFYPSSHTTFKSIAFLALLSTHTQSSSLHTYSVAVRQRHSYAGLDVPFNFATRSPTISPYSRVVCLQNDTPTPRMRRSVQMQSNHTRFGHIDCYRDDVDIPAICVRFMNCEPQCKAFQSRFGHQDIYV
jgi:hypothetical protein